MAPGSRVALLPLPLLALLVAAGAAVGALLAEPIGEGWVAGVPAAAVAWPGAYVLRRLLARRAAESFDELPSLENRGFGTVLCSWAMLATIGAVIGVLTRAGVEETAAIAIGAAVGFPVWNEVDARLGRRAQRKADEEELRLTTAAEDPARAASTQHTIGIRRWRAVLETLVVFAAAAGCAAFAVLGEDAGFGRVAVGVCAPILVIVGVRYVRWARAETFVRADGHGIELLGSPVVAWEDVLGVYVSNGYGRRQLTVWREEEKDLEAPLWLAAASTEDVLALIRSQSEVPIDVELG